MRISKKASLIAVSASLLLSGSMSVVDAETNPPDAKPAESGNVSSASVDATAPESQKSAPQKSEASNSSAEVKPASAATSESAAGAGSNAGNSAGNSSKNAPVNPPLKATENTPADSSANPSGSGSSVSTTTQTEKTTNSIDAANEAPTGDPSFVNSMVKQAAALKSTNSKSAPLKPAVPESHQTRLKTVPAAASGERGLGEEFAAKFKAPPVSNAAKTVGPIIPTKVSTTAGQVNRFAFKLLSVTDKTTKNAVLSPVSAYLAMSMVLDGASGATANEIARALQLTAADRAQLDQRNKQLTASIMKMKDVQIANALFADTTSPFLASFLDVNKQFYDARVENMSFSATGSVAKVNDWVGAKTHGKIPEILKAFPRNAKLLLLNATYFKGTWVHQFDKKLTKNGSFTSLGGAKNIVPMMHLHDSLKYVESSKFEMLKIPYAASKLSMFVLLPAKNQDFNKFANGLSADIFDDAVHHMNVADVELTLPRFKVETSVSLVNQLKALGLSKAFDVDAGGFTKMTKTPVRIDQVLQKTFLDVNEEGTTAAAVTMVEMGGKGMFFEAPKDTVNFIVDRPFIVALKDESTGNLLFLGAIIKR